MFVAGVVALAFVAVAVDFFVFQEGFDGVGELEFAAGAGGDAFDHFEDARGEDVAADDGVLRGLGAGFGLFYHVLDGEEAWVFGVGGDVEAAVGLDGVAFYDFGAEDAGLGLVEGFDHLLHAGGGGVYDVVGEEDGEGLVADDLFGHEDGVAEAEGFGLADVDDLGELGDGLGDFEEAVLFLAAREASSSADLSKWSSMVDLPRPVTMMISVQPAATASSTPYWMRGLSTRQSISLGVALVAGRKRVPMPAAGKTALRIFICGILGRILYMLIASVSVAKG